MALQMGPPQSAESGRHLAVGTLPTERNGAHNFICPHPASACLEAMLYRPSQYQQIKAASEEEFSGRICLKAPGHPQAGQAAGLAQDKEAAHPCPWPHQQLRFCGGKMSESHIQRVPSGLNPAKSLQNGSPSSPLVEHTPLSFPFSKNVLVRYSYKTKCEHAQGKAEWLLTPWPAHVLMPEFPKLIVCYSQTT